MEPKLVWKASGSTPVGVLSAMKFEICAATTESDVAVKALISDSRLVRYTSALIPALFSIGLAVTSYQALFGIATGR